MNGDATEVTNLRKAFKNVASHAGAEATSLQMAFEKATLKASGGNVPTQNETQELFELKQKIGEAKDRYTELTGKEKHILNQLKNADKWQIRSIREAVDLLTKYDKKIEKLSVRLRQGTEAIKEKLDE